MAPAVICSNGAQTLAPNKLLRSHNTAAETQVFRGPRAPFSAAAERDAAPSVFFFSLSSCFHSDTEPHHASETFAHQVCAKCCVWGLLLGHS